MSEIKPKTIALFILVASAIGLVLTANNWKSSLRIKQIKIEGNRIVGENEILQLTQVQMNSLLYDADLSVIQQNVMSHHYIKDAMVERTLPNSIHIQVVERVPIVIVNRPETTYIDECGVVLPRSISHRLYDLPMITGISESEPLIPGSIVKQPDVIEALQLLATLKIVNRSMFHNISEVQVRNGGDIVLYSTEGGVPIIFGHNEMSSKLIRLEAFWNTVVRTRGTQLLQYIDLRYQDQIIARWKPEPSATKSL
jgi:cell division septal protein FtsQ